MKLIRSTDIDELKTFFCKFCTNVINEKEKIVAIENYDKNILFKLNGSRVLSIENQGFKLFLAPTFNISAWFPNNFIDHKLSGMNSSYKHLL